MLLTVLTFTAIAWTMVVLGIVALCKNAARGDRVAVASRAPARRRRLVA